MLPTLSAELRSSSPLEPRPYDEDIWDLRDLGVNNFLSAHVRTLNFSTIQPEWLRQAAKQYVRYSLAFKTGGTCVTALAALRQFGVFLQSRYPAIEAHQINRGVIVTYLGELARRSLKPATRKAYTAHLRSLLETSAREGWVAFPKEPLISFQDYPRRSRPQPRFIPEDVLDQLNRHQSALPTHWKRMLLIVQECGMRISELITLPYDCLIQDATGDAFLRSYQYKMKKEHTIPVSRDVANVIRAQQQEVAGQWGLSARYLFPNRQGEPYRPSSFGVALNRLASAQGIRTSSGHPFRFHAHQFRHTVGTRMINNGVPQHLVQRYLGHESPEMTTWYAHIFDQTLKEEFAKFRGKIVDSAGRVIEQDARVATPDLQWLKRSILGQALPNGYCGLPVVAGPCPHANACLTCTHFRTDASFLPQHQSQLSETQRIIEVAQVQGWTRQLEMNNRVATNLQAIIDTLTEPPGGA